MSATITTAVSNRTFVRCSTYSGAPSLHPSITPTMESHASRPVDSARNTLNGPPADLKGSDLEKIIRTPSTTSSTLEARSQDLKDWAATFDRMADRRLDQQRFVPTVKKTDEISTNALGAKLERALGRRMSGQDAVFRRRDMNEKVVRVAAS